jgi:crossover junction endodeoxyribonuclease RuvC
MQGSIIALDLATATGWAVGMPEAEPRFGTFTLPSTGDDIGRFLVKFEDWLNDMITVEGPGLVVFEAPILRRGGGNPVVARKLMGLANCVETICYRRDVRCRQAHLATVKKSFAGSGRAEKSDMIAMARRWGWAVRNDNEADALGLWQLAVRMAAPEVHKRRFGMGPLQASAGAVA